MSNLSSKTCSCRPTIKNGDWVKLFQRAPGYIRSDLYKDNSSATSYMTVDCWRAKKDYEYFFSRWMKDYKVLDQKCEAWTQSEALVAEFADPKQRSKTKEKRFLFWQRCLLCASLLQAAFGLVLALMGPSKALPFLFDRYQSYLSKWSPEPSPHYQEWFFGMLGATIASWAIALVLIIHIPFKKRERWARNAIAMSLFTWFPIDTAMSIHSGVYPNVAFNGIAFLMILIPLFATWKHFNEEREFI